MKYSPITVLTFLSCLAAISGLQSQAPQTQRLGVCGSSTSSNTALNVVGVETVGIALISAAAGAAARQPEIETLQSELRTAREALEESKESMVKKIAQLEDKLFEMDNAYEAQTTKFQKEYEVKQQAEIEKLEDKMKTDYRYKLDIEVEREKSKLLSGTLSEVNNLEQEAKLSKMRMRQNELENIKSTLERAVEKAEKEIEELKANKKKGGFWSF